MTEIAKLYSGINRVFHDKKRPGRDRVLLYDSATQSYKELADASDDIESKAKKEP